MGVTDFMEATRYADAQAEYFGHMRPKCGTFSDKLIVYIAKLFPIVASAFQRRGAWTGEIIVAVTEVQEPICEIYVAYPDVARGEVQVPNGRVLREQKTTCLTTPSQGYSNRTARRLSRKRGR